MHTYVGRGAAGGDTARILGAGDVAVAQSKQELMAALLDLMDEGKAFLKSTAGLSGEAVEGARETFAARLSDARERWGHWSETARVKGRRAFTAADDYVHENPWRSVALIAAAAFTIAALATRR